MDLSEAAKVLACIERKPFMWDLHDWQPLSCVRIFRAFAATWFVPAMRPASNGFSLNLAAIA